jgi:hypothetical protein
MKRKKTKHTPRKRLTRRSDTKRKRNRAQVPTFKELLLAIPQDGGTFERMEIQFRDVDFGEP